MWFHVNFVEYLETKTSITLLESFGTACFVLLSNIKSFKKQKQEKAAQGECTSRSLIYMKQQRNVFVKPNDQSDACISFGMARKRLYLYERFHTAESRGQACLDYAEARKRSDEIQDFEKHDE